MYCEIHENLFVANISGHILMKNAQLQKLPTVNKYITEKLRNTSSQIKVGLQNSNESTHLFYGLYYR
jgi:hypothetical protein